MLLKEEDLAKAREERTKQWEEAYARIGQAPPGPPPDEQPIDSRPLAERLREQRVRQLLVSNLSLHSSVMQDKKEEEFQDKVALSESITLISIHFAHTTGQNINGAA